MSFTSIWHSLARRSFKRGVLDGLMHHVIGLSSNRNETWYLCKAPPRAFTREAVLLKTAANPRHVCTFCIGIARMFENSELT